ncbi:hypothetical protein TNCV_1536131 [Trichonephila clavipes]|nr:hypothetical protein TNCV_1536131 [Trichonephila clavipes]
MCENVTKDLVTVLREMGETVDSDLGILELKQKLSCKEYVEDKEFVCDFLDTMIEERMEEEERRKRDEKQNKNGKEVKAAEEVGFKAEEEEGRLKGGEHARLKAGKPKQWRKGGTLKRRIEERRMNERIVLEEEMRLKERWLVEEQMRHVQEKHKMRMKEEQKCLPEEQTVDLKASSNMELIPQLWSFKREYSQDKRGRERLAWELLDFINQIDVVKVQQ